MTGLHPNPYDAPTSSPDAARRSTSAPTDWKTWSPFQSQSVRNICANMTREEKSAVMRRGMIYGLWVAVSVALPLQLIFIGYVAGNGNPIVAAVGGFLIVAHFVAVPIWQRSQRQFLCTTIWARENGIEPDSLKLFKFGRATRGR